jgi:DNA-binding CsgD family transcriptional regulator
MSQAAAAPSHHTALRVAIVTNDAERRADLYRIVAGAGHEVEASVDLADVALVEGEPSLIHVVAPIVTLGGSDGDQAGLLPRDATPEQIDAAIRAVAAGLIVRSTEDDEAVFGAIPEPSLHDLLTPREVEVLDAISHGLSNKAIARRLDISLHTVKFHVESVFRKLGARSRAEAVARALIIRRREMIDL